MKQLNSNIEEAVDKMLFGQKTQRLAKMEERLRKYKEKKARKIQNPAK